MASGSVISKVGRGINIHCINYISFLKVFCFSFCQEPPPPPHQDSLMQISCGSPGCVALQSGSVLRRSYLYLKGQSVSVGTGFAVFLCFKFSATMATFLLTALLFIPILCYQPCSVYRVYQKKVYSWKILARLTSA